MKRRTVKKITPSQRSSFDQQFWPIVVAVTVLSGIALGAIMTILRGPWMWGSLLILPLMAAASLFFLFQLDDSRLKRSLQFAIICSMAAHMLVLVFASVIHIFENPFKPKQREVATQQRVRTIEISDQRASFVWEETNDRTTPEPEVEQQRQKPTTNVTPQTVPVEEIQPTVKPQIVRRETPSETVPKQNRELSKLRRQTENQQPRSSQKATGAEVAQNQPKPTEPAKQATAEDSQQSVSVERQTTTERQPTPSPPTPTTMPESAPKPEIARATPQPRKTELTESATASMPKPSSSTARIYRTTPKIPKASKAVPVSEKVASATAKTRVETQPSKAASEVTRREVKRDIIRPTATDAPDSNRSPKPQIARATTVRRPEPSKPTISTETSRQTTPRRATSVAPSAVSPVALENPSRAPESQTATRELKSKTLSVSRSTEGVVGVGRSQNLDRFTGGMTTPARQASNSARRERTSSATKDPQMLVSSSRSELRRAVGFTPTPTSAFKADTTSAAKIAGASEPGEKTLESSAAAINSASTAHRDTISAERGSANVDLGPTKIVRDRPAKRLSGGGQPEVAHLNPDRTRRSRDRSDQQPSLDAATGPEVMAPSNPSGQPSSSVASEVSSRNVTVARAGGREEITFEKWSADETGEALDMGQSDLVDRLADARQRADRDQSELAWEEEEEDEDEENTRGTIRTRIAQAPVTQGDVGFGVARDTGMSEQVADAGESIAAKLTRQATASIPGSGIGQTAASALLRAANSLPVISSTPGDRSSRSPMKSTQPIEGYASNAPRTRSSRGNRPSASPKTNSSATPTVAAASNSTGESSSRSVEATNVEIARSDNAEAMEQVQGTKLDILAMEGPAGLGDRPDNYIGVMVRPASRDSEQIQLDVRNRFRKSVYGGMPSINPDAVIAKDAFRNRSPRALSKATEPTTEAAIQLGLEFLARHQSADGSWTLTKFDRDDTQHISQLDSDTAATGLALLAFQGAGYNHREFKYARQVDHGIQWLIENQAANGGLYVPTDKKSNGACRLYSHGIAALALTEAYGMTQDARLKEPAQKAIDYIIETQDDRKGGWRYFDTPGMKSTDTSVSGWMMMALQSGRLAGLDVEQQSFDGIEDWLDVAASPDSKSLYRYNPYAVDSKGVSRIQGRKPTATMTSVGLLMRIYSGWERDDERLLAGADYLMEEQMPNDSTPAERDTYYWYYATQVLKYIGGERWDRWNQTLRPLLIRSQEKTGDLAGSWHPYQPVPDRWGAFGGRLYVTTMNLLSLEVRHRMLPLYQQGEPKLEGEIMSIKGEQPVSTTINRSSARPTQPPTRRAPTVTEPTPGAASKVNRIERQKTPPRVAMKPPIEPDTTPIERSTRTRPGLRSPSNSPKTAAVIVARAAETASTLTPTPEASSKVNAIERERSTPRIAMNPGAELETAPIESSPRVEPQTRRKPSLTTPATDPIVESVSRTPTRTGNRPTPRAPKARPPEAEATKRKIVANNPPAQPKTTSSTTPKPDAEKTKPKPPEFVSVAGTVTLDGQLLKDAKIEFIPINGNEDSVVGKTNNVGRYNVSPSAVAKRPGIKPGEYKVAITTFVESPDLDLIDLLEVVPEKYNTSTRLKVRIKPNSKNVFDFKLRTE